ncbi:unnamed protein product, partial [Vitis vinifera]|uniref:Sucrose phosphatase-like domain-containing protein n=1 Tax=Vitis vinifera TaxID=29760 RepID=D7SRJ4_VITVI
MASSNGNSSVSYHSGRRQGLFVIAADCYDSNGDCTERLPTIIKNVMKSTSSGLGRIGFVLLTGLSLQEILEKLRCCQVNLEEIDALVCNSGIEIYYPWRDLIADLEYEAHVENRWPGESVRSVVTRLAQGEGGAEDDIVEYAGVCSTRCYSYGVKPGAKTRRIDDLRQRMWMRGFRCNLVYTHATSRLNVHQGPKH